MDQVAQRLDRSGAYPAIAGESRALLRSMSIGAMTPAAELVEQRLQLWTSKQGGADRILSYGVKETNAIEFSVSFGENNRYEAKIVPTVESGFTFEKEALYFKNSTGSGISNLDSGHKESNLQKAATRDDPLAIHKMLTHAKYCYAAISSWKIYHFHDTSDTAGVKRVGALHDNNYLRHDASNLAAFLYKLKNHSFPVYEQICKTVRLVLPFFDDFVLEPQKLPTEEEQIRLLWKQKENDYALWPSQLSDGSIRFICLVTALLQPDPPSTIFIVEPELGLHPYAISILGGLFRVASSRMQLIISTQSVPLLNEFSIDNLIVVERENGASLFKRLDENQFDTWLENYSIGELWEKNILGGRPHA